MGEQEDQRAKYQVLPPTVDTDDLVIEIPTDGTVEKHPRWASSRGDAPGTSFG
jgi:hypothetical protein